MFIFYCIATNGQICDAVRGLFERVGKGIAYFMLVAGVSSFRVIYGRSKHATVLIHKGLNT